LGIGLGSSLLPLGAGVVNNTRVAQAVNFYRKPSTSPDLYYAIQVDSDTLTLRKPDEVCSFIEDQRTFTLGGEKYKSGMDIVPMEEACRHGKDLQLRGIDHVQVSAEANFDKLSNFKSLKYVRGCAAFVGFAKQSFSREIVEELSRRLAEIVGPDELNEWGSDQVASNIIVANIPGAAVLPLPKYCDQFPGRDVVASTFVHFIGTNRFIKGDYFALSKSVINELRDSALVN